ncbi:MAG: YeeE/YedE family protein, partial [Deltaproteobacteria bacterium]|nr:YeeE/YedE family protein [Deltaproteobacteria bacterium]
MTILPLYGLDILGYQGGLVVFTLVGVAFGFVLERAGFGQAPILAAQFYGTDMRVLKVMFTAIVTALFGLTLFSGLGILDLSLVQVTPTYLWPALIGGLLLGVGFVVSGYCPGTAVVGLSSGNMDAGFTILGVTVGSILFGPAYPLLLGFYESGAQGVLRFPELLGVPQAVLALAVFGMAVGAFFFGEWVERFFSQRAGIEAPPSVPRTRNRVFVGLAVAAALGLGTLALPKVVVPEEAGREVAQLDLEELTHTLIERPDTLWVVDLRSPSACQEARIPGALCRSAEDPDGAFMKTLPPTRRLVLYGEGEV